MIRFPRRGLENCALLPIKRGGRDSIARVKAREMCNWIDCDVCFGEEEEGDEERVNMGLRCSKCMLVKYCGSEHQLADWPVSIYFTSSHI